MYTYCIFIYVIVASCECLWRTTLIIQLNNVVSCYFSWNERNYDSTICYMSNNIYLTLSLTICQWLCLLPNNIDALPLIQMNHETFRKNVTGTNSVKLTLNENCFVKFVKSLFRYLYCRSISSVSLQLFFFFASTIQQCDHH